MSHLSESAQAALELSDHDRMLRIRSSSWIWYPRAAEMLEALEDLITHPKSYRMPNMLITGSTNNGKTAIARAFIKQHPTISQPEDEADVVPVLYIQAPPVPDERRFNAVLLDQLRIPHKVNERADRMAQQFLHIAPKLGVQMLIVDEIHHILAAPALKQRAFLQLLKYFGNELLIPIVAIGTEDALYALQSDSQIANRFKPAVIPEWKFDSDFLALLRSFEEMLPLRYPSDLTEVKLASRILSLSEGLIGEIGTLLKTAAVLAIRTKDEKISLSVLDKLQWAEPSQRRIRASQLVS
jgi:hypothetical protein